MTPILALALLAPQNLQDTYGKTNAQIVAMGHDAWGTFYNKKAGNSTMAMSSGEGLYAEALRARNDALLARRPDRKTLVALRKALVVFADDAVEAGRVGTGGGTMWNPVSNAYWGIAETAVSRMMVPGKPAPHRVTSDVARELPLLRKALANPYLAPEDLKKVGPAMARLEGDWKAVSALASTRSRRESDLALEFCRSTLRDVRQTVGPN